MSSYASWAELYDAIYSATGKNYEQETLAIDAIVRERKRSAGQTLLDVACGTGLHLVHFQQLGYQAEGLDLEPEMLKIARQRNPDIVFHLGNMIGFDLDKQFDVVTCLFSAIGYVKTVENLRQTVLTLAKHLLPGGVLIVQPWLMPENYKTGTVHAAFVDQPNWKIARINTNERVGNLSVLNFHFLVGTPQGVKYFTQRDELGLFTHEEYLVTFEKAGLNVVHLLESKNSGDRGFYVGSKPVS